NEHSEITHYTNFLDRIMKGQFDNPDKHVVRWPNTALNESKARKFEGRVKQPDFTVSIVSQLQTSATIFVGGYSTIKKR
ncbi:1300_t:CDS:1, partial [Ambispora gerdemannii]